MDWRAQTTYRWFQCTVHPVNTSWSSPSPVPDPPDPPSLTLLPQITHDRFFLERVCGEMLELDGEGGQRHVGSYSSFLEAKAAREAAEAAIVERAQTVLRKESEWMRRQPKVCAQALLFSTQGLCWSPNVQYP